MGGRTGLVADFLFGKHTRIDRELNRKMHNNFMKTRCFERLETAIRIIGTGLTDFFSKKTSVKWPAVRAVVFTRPDGC
jgi:hypothetical protein